MRAPSGGNTISPGRFGGNVGVWACDISVGSMMSGSEGGE